MDANQIVKVLNGIGCRGIKVRNAQWVVCCCPLAGLTGVHAGGTDSKPSFGVRIDPKGVSNVNCQTCHYGKNYGGRSKDRDNGTRSLGMLLQKLCYEFKLPYGRVTEFVLRHDIPDLDVVLDNIQTATYEFEPPKEVAGIRVSGALARSATQLGYVDHEDVGVKELPNEDLERMSYLPVEALKYLTSSKRRITEDTAREWKLGWHPGVKRVAIPIWDCKQRLVGLTGARAYEHQKPKFLHASGYLRDLYLYGEHRIVPNKPVILVEGFWDALYLWQQGYVNALAVQGSWLSKFQAEKIVRFFSTVIIFPDGDPPGAIAAEQWRGVLSERLPTFLLDTPEGRDPDELLDSELDRMLGPFGCRLDA